ncbi:MAG: elongation factor P, partial [Clostridia bacterium]|nr:elongation factor P [Clostridia bacterium]
NDGDLWYFMDMETFDMLPLNFDIVEEAMQFVKEEMMVTVQTYKGEAFSVVAPNFVELEVASTEPGIQGDTSKAGNKPATLETGFNIQVPLFVNTGDRIRVDTRTGTYMERVK